MKLKMISKLPILAVDLGIGESIEEA